MRIIIKFKFIKNIFINKILIFLNKILYWCINYPMKEFPYNKEVLLKRIEEMKAELEKKRSELFSKEKIVNFTQQPKIRRRFNL